MNVVLPRTRENDAEFVIGATLPCVPGGATSYSPWFPREGDAATFGCELIGADASGSLVITVQHKNHGDTDASATTAGTFSTITSLGTTTLRAGSLKEMIRYRYVTDLVDESPFSWLHFRMLRPSWETNIES